LLAELDTVSAEKRSRMMSGIRGKNTRPEIVLRKALFRHGFRYRLHDKRIPGNPDLVLRKYDAVIFINGCFWHGHGCHLFKWPKSRAEFWREKINSNMARDQRNLGACREAGYRVAIVWECALKGRGKLPFHEVTNKVIDWIRSDEPVLDLGGTVPG